MKSCGIWVFAFLVAVFSSASFGGDVLGCGDQFDREIKKAAKRYLPTVDWRLLKAQYCQESRLKPGATSPVGAQGIAQIMPGTWLDIAPALGLEWASPYMVGPGIIAGAYYMQTRRDVWKAPRPDADRHSLALASYNAGAGHLINAQKKCGGRNLYGEIIRCLPAVTGDHSRETITYVDRIWRIYMRELLGL